MNKTLMTCSHCLRQFGLLHCGSGPSYCCECVHVRRLWLALEKRGVDQHNKYAEESLADHANGAWCVGARLEDDQQPFTAIGVQPEDQVLDASEIG